MKYLTIFCLLLSLNTHAQVDDSIYTGSIFRKADGLLIDLGLGYSECYGNDIRKWSSSIGHPLGSPSQLLFNFDINGIINNYIIKFGLNIAANFQTSTGPTYISTGLDFGYAAIIHPKLILLPTIGCYYTNTELNFHDDRPSLLKNIKEVPLGKDALLYQSGIAIHPGFKLCYFPNPKNLLFLSISGYTMVNAYLFDWQYGYKYQNGKYVNYETNPVHQLNPQSSTSSWGLLAGIGIGRLTKAN